MKQIISLIIFLLVSQTNFSQNISVEKSIYNIQSGVLGIWINNETKITNTIALKTEIGLDAGVFGGEIHGENSGLFLAPVINIEPRWYYNINQRNLKNKNTANNSANFLTTTLSYHPDWFVIGQSNTLNVHNQLSINPKWGIRRNIGKSNFNYEVGFCVGYKITFQKQYGYEDSKDVIYDLHLRVGYKL